MLPPSENLTSATSIKKSGLRKTSASEAAKISKPRFEMPPTGGSAAVSAALKNGELADRVADFIEITPFRLAIGRSLERGRSYSRKSVW
ncbi:hypothetical protein D9M72_622320 [compost metagenome]